MAVTRLRTYIENLVTAIRYIFVSFGIFCQKALILLQPLVTFSKTSSNLT